jgi:uncharacterized membrane protein
MKFNLKNKTFLIGLGLSLVVIWGIFLRSYNISEQPYWMDEGYTINATTSILEKGVSVLDSDEYYHCPIYCYPTAGLTKIFGATPIAFRLLAILAGVAIIALAFSIAKKFYNKNIAILTAVFVSLSYWQIAWSRQARWYTLLILFFWSTWYFFYKYLNTKKPKDLVALLILLIFTILTHKIGYFLILAMIIWYFFDQFYPKLKQKTLNKSDHLRLSIIAIALIVIMIVIERITFSGFLWQNIKNITLHYKLPFYLNFYIKTYILFLFFTLYYFFTRKSSTERRLVLFILWPFVIYLILYSFLSNIVHYRYLFPTTLAFYILGSAGIIEFVKNIKRSKNRKIIVIIIAGLFLLSHHIVIIPRSHYILEADSPNLSGRPYYSRTPQPDFNKGYNFIIENLNNNEIVISSHPHFNKIFLNQPGYWIKYNYLGFSNDLNSKYGDGDQEYYVGAKIIDDLAELKEITDINSGYLIWDFAGRGHIDNNIEKYVENNFEEVFYNRLNSYSKIWIYKF